MAVVKHPKSPNWYVRFTAPDGRRIFQSAGTRVKRDAEEYEAQLRDRLWRQHRLGESQATWREAVVAWLSSTTHKDRSGVEQRLRWLDQHLGSLSLREIDQRALYAVRDAKLAEGCKPATANRHLAAVSAVLHHARSRGWLDAVPAMPRMKEPRGKLRWLSVAEARVLVDHLRARPRCQHIADMAEFTLSTGLREANVTGLEWSRVDLDRRFAFVPGEQSKSGRAIRVPLNDVAMRVLESRKGVHDLWVFTHRGRKLRKAGHDGFRQSVEACGLTGVTWHTLRHTWASWHAQAGTPMQVLMELGGWSSMQMVLRYAHLAPDHLAEFAGNAVENW
ncbi:MAG: tyrosine-type recombinase/integrase [Xanthomonadales bacterium]|nr:tyrosine-type recombinase/integrase [Xanthomonadales bacterium]